MCEVAPLLYSHKFVTAPYFTKNNIFPSNQRTYFLQRNGENTSRLFSQTRFVWPFLFSLVELETLLYQFTIFTMDSNEILRMHQLLEVEDLSFKLQLEEAVSFVTISFPRFIFVSHNPKIKPHT